MSIGSGPRWPKLPVNNKIFPRSLIEDVLSMEHGFQLCVCDVRVLFEFIPETFLNEFSGTIMARVNDVSNWLLLEHFFLRGKLLFFKRTSWRNNLRPAFMLFPDALYGHRCVLWNKGYCAFVSLLFCFNYSY